ncbi:MULTISPECIES: NAD(P)-dependent oxidoreductase [Streptomycetaceae]|uniref:NAD(P)-dependent oxidoreductase n=1 Tax=Streptomycetaceae TaxID=2062 RepID=UPI00093DB6BD|nr:NAD(P)-dependent oxidoreductase [Streptomyces sp. CB02056]OKH97535.1 phosphogluconate dehydrogenase [Streptomyces sp. CB02056]
MTAARPVLAVLHPGNMGATVAACAASTGVQVLWCPAGRSAATVRRAAQAGLEPVAELDELLERAEVVLSLCPPAVAEDVARDVAERRFAGVYVEGNAISPDRAQRIADLVGRSARAVVDGSVIGSPPVGGKHTKLFLSGPSDAAALVAALFSDTAVSTPVLGGTIGQASALKVSYTAYQKASRVLAALSYGLAQYHGVDQALLDVAGKRAGSYLTETGYIAKTAARAWRWAPEMEEAADTLNAAGLPDEVLRAVAETLGRWTAAKDNDEISVEGALTILREPK